jgi:predicted ATPase
MGTNAAELAEIAPSLRRVLPDIPQPLELPSAQKRRYLFESVSEALTRAAQTCSYLYILDDLHWADESTLALLIHLSEAFQLHLGQLVQAIEPAKEFQLQILKLSRMFDSATELQDSFAQLMETFKGGPLSGRTGVDAAPVQAAAQH